jgi:hypothetical protein
LTGLAFEVNSGLSVTLGNVVSIGITLENDSSFSFTSTKRILLDIPSSLESALSLLIAEEVAIIGGKFITGQEYQPGFKSGQVYHSGFQNGQEYQPGFKSGQEH